MNQQMNQQVTLKNYVTTDYAYEEAIKTLRTNIQFCGSSIRAIMLTSSVPNEGKSDITFSLARSFAQTGKKVLLIDADIRKSVLVTRYQLEKDICGLSQFLSGQKKREEVLYSTNLEGLDVIFSGPYSPNPAELLEEGLFRSLVEWGKAEYDYVIIDTPPISNVIDGAIVARVCDGAVLVIESGAISYRVAQRVKQQMEKTGCRILGAILNRVGGENDGYYSKQYGSYRKYGRYYEYAKYSGYYGKENGGLKNGHEEDREKGAG